jgi:DNA polymerase III gamma/tau subunit
MTNYKAWFEKYRPKVLGEVVFPNQDIQNIITRFYEQEFISGNILSYGPAGLGKTTISEVLIHKIIKSPSDLFILGRKTEDVDNLKTWLMQGVVHSNQKIVKIEEMDRLSSQAQIVLKDGLMEKYQHNTTFLATTNNPEKIDPALITRFNTRINFGGIPQEMIISRLETILKTENVSYHDEDLEKFVNDFHKRGLRDLINNLELASREGLFNPKIIDSFVGISGNEDLVVQYIEYLVKYSDSKSKDEINTIIDNPKADSQFFTYYDYLLTVLKNELRLNYHAVYDKLFSGDLDFSAKNIIEDSWQDLELKRFKSTHVVALLHDLILNIYNQKG